MSNMESQEPEPSRLVEAIFWIGVTTCAVTPWVLQIAIGWWAGLLSIPLLFILYDFLFAPRGGVCMGVPFMIPLGRSFALVAVNTAVFLKWVVGRWMGG